MTFDLNKTRGIAGNHFKGIIFYNDKLVIMSLLNFIIILVQIPTSESDVYRRQILTSIDVRFWLLAYRRSDSDVHRRQILTSIDARFWRL